MLSESLGLLNELTFKFNLNILGDQVFLILVQNKYYSQTNIILQYSIS